MSVREGLTSAFKEIFQTAIISLGIFFFVYVFLVQPHKVKGNSMLPNFVDGELLLTEKVSYHLSRPDRGEVIVFRAPTARNLDYIKRIIGLPEETIAIENGSVSINGEKLIEPYISVPTEGSVNRTLGRDEFFVLGDNRGESSDSRSFGPIKQSSFRGKSWLVYWPILKSGPYKGFRIISGIHYSITNSLNSP